MAHFLVILLDDKRFSAIKGTEIEEKVSNLFGGALKAINVEVPEDAEKKIMETFTSARIDSRGAITDVPIAFTRAIFEEIAAQKSIGAEIFENVFSKIEEIKEAAAKESSCLPPPDIDISDIEELQKHPYQGE
ncbi:MAG: hypothetical protein Q9M37_03165 [Desulfonauticus sp.]|nr:hypothetical protein [Desulfonauticus sp.]